MSAQTQALQALIALVAAAVKDSVAALQPGENLLQKLMGYENLVPQVMALVPQIGNLSVQGLQPSDYVQLAENLVSNLGLSSAHAQAIMNASFKLLNDGVALVPDMEALVAAIKNPPAAS